jgi:diadenosine tetraphosphate (Ap4A) HIT family hydrolase
MSVAEGCPLCPDNGMLKAEVLAKREQAYMMENIFNPGCFLIVPTNHTESLQDLPDDWWSDFKQLLAQVPLSSDSYNLSLNMGKQAGQSLGHLHFWIIPRSENKPSSGKGMAGLIALVDSESANE